MKSEQFVKVDDKLLVAPHAGAWIEIAQADESPLFSSLSPPMRGRGLKLLAV